MTPHYFTTYTRRILDGELLESTTQHYTRLDLRAFCVTPDYPHVLHYAVARGRRSMRWMQRQAGVTPTEAS